ncbi:heterocycloanthracin/sonorensin family bacteriocin [Bacillus pseudomycoides]|uniref:heterocycloanthracin/sonorensin family bacteriocin n=1 Tax=Bacillus pseudomycoides TaxID=64104 RepID=UPI0002E7053A|nr:heterocycloanthracin/sonorensin family bacteriocin [Bacillus pseudomycoides]PDZ11551.1 heterocycloanthracin/sonorensin family bacteriocin [Bacillus pseudomycoides]PGC39096.1 heterocycloanthracin/sonorensin family bacteriocin [Bacillus pseudomycoides]
MNEFQQELQALSLNDYQSGNVVYWDQQNQYPYYYIEDDARRCGGCGRCGGFRCFGCFGCFSCFGCGGCGGCSNCFDGFNGATWWVI